MIDLLNLEVLKKLLFSFFLFTFALLMSYLFWQLTFAKEVTREVAREAATEITKEVITNKAIDELGEIVGAEVWDRVRDLPIEKSALTKLLQDIIGIQMAEQLLPDCEQYVLRVVEPGMFPVLQTTHNNRPEIKSWIWLNVGEEWRCGMTQKDEASRYPGGVFFISKDGMHKLTKFNLKYYPEFKGNLMEVLIEEKIKIYTYPLRDECIKRVSTGGEFFAIPPGNKVHK